MREPMRAEPVREPVREAPRPEPVVREAPPRDSLFAEPAAQDLPLEEPEQSDEEIPFYRKVLAQRHADDPGGYGPNWSNVDDYDIPTVLRKQMD